jgi:hypothetical protein
VTIGETKPTRLATTANIASAQSEQPHSRRATAAQAACRGSSEQLAGDQAGKRGAAPLTQIKPRRRPGLRRPGLWSASGERGKVRTNAGF